MFGCISLIVVCIIIILISVYDACRYTGQSSLWSSDQVARAEWDLELTPAAKAAANTRFINQMDDQLAELGIFEAQQAVTERKLRGAYGVPTHCIHTIDMLYPVEIVVPLPDDPFIAY